MPGVSAPSAVSSPTGNAVPLQVAARPFEGCRAFQRPESGSSVLSRRGATVDVGCCQPSNEGNPVLRVRRGRGGFRQREHRSFACFACSAVRPAGGDWGGSSGGWRDWGWHRSATRTKGLSQPWAEAPRLPSRCRSATPWKWPNCGGFSPWNTCDCPVRRGRRDMAIGVGVGVGIGIGIGIPWPR